MIPSYPRLGWRWDLEKREGGREGRDLFVARTRNVANVYVGHMDVRVSTKSEEIPVSFSLAGEGRKGKERGETHTGPSVKQIRMNKFPLHRVTATLHSPLLFSFFSSRFLSQEMRFDLMSGQDLDGLLAGTSRFEN